MFVVAGPGIQNSRFSGRKLAMASSANEILSNERLLESWKEIAAYLQRDLNTAMRLTVMANVSSSIAPVPRMPPKRSPRRSGNWGDGPW